MRRHQVQELDQEVDLKDSRTMWVVAFHHRTEHGDWQFVPRLHSWVEACLSARTKRKELERDGIMDPDSTCVVPCELYVGWGQAIPVARLVQIDGNFAVESPPPPPSVVE